MSLKINKSIVLIGIMGAGKTSIGKRLAKKLQTPFVDIDNQIEGKEGRSVSRIFEEDGEDKFRALEKEQIEVVIRGGTHVIATGGGAFINEDIRRIIKENTISIWLNAPLDILVERVSRKKTRPLLEKGDKREIMQNLMRERCPIYEQADIMVESTVGPHYIVVEKIIEKLREYDKGK